ncbi:hypothetical protein [Tenacibaculum sp. SZ-18]|uniref:hypothetical protein n=1 Tax=Tenacibaculum sp. SZ-18 TaxID=754423 RepID=UPI0012FD5421|nr:hypothetical protein [Tenacibaculum sp. SZ-18]
MSKLFSDDYKSFEIDDKIEIIDLDSVSNFSELRQKMGKLTCEGKSSGLRFKSNDTIYHLIGFANCPSSVEIGCYFRRNLLFVRNDSLVIEYGKSKKKKSITFLKAELNEIISKTYNFQYNENKLKPALIHFYVEDKYPIETTKRTLKEIVRQFKEINSQNGSDYFRYNILFEGFDITNIPPSPPPPKPNEFDNEKK